MGTSTTRSSEPYDAREGTFANLFRHLRSGVAHCRMVFEGDVAVDWVYLHVNDAFVRQTGLRDVAGRRLSEVIPGLLQEDPEPFAHYAQVVTTGESAEFEQHVKALDAWFAVSVYRPAPGEFVAVFDPITERKRAEAVMRESEARYRALFEQASVGMAHVAQETGRFLAVNDAFCAIVGRAREELLRLTVGDVTHPDDRAEDSASLAQMHEGKRRGFTREKRYLRGDGTVFWGRVTVSGLARSSFASTTNMALLEDIDERRRATDALAESDQRLRAVFRGSLAGLVIVDLATRCVVDVSESFVALFGWSREELVGHTTDQVDFYVEASDRDRIAQGFAHPGVPLEFRVKRKSGEVGAFLVTLAQIEVDGAPCGISMWHDVTELRRADAALRASERHLRTTFDLAPIGIAESDPKTGRWRRVNRRICEITGYSAEELSALSIPDELTHPDDRASSRAWFNDVNAGVVGPSHFQRRYVRKDGSVAWVEIDVAILRDDAGNTTGTLAAIEDVTERKRAEAALQASQARYRELVDNLEDVVFTVDAQGALAFINRAIASFGYVPSSLHGVPFVDLLHPDDRAHFGPLLRDGSGNLPRELRLYDADGKLRHVRISLRHASEAEQRTGMAGVLVDITRQRETEEQLRAAQKMEAIGRLAGGVAHDFNNLLSVILSYTELAVEALPEQDQLAIDLREVMKAGLRAEGLTRQLLAFSRRQVLNPEPLALSELVAGLSTMLTRLIGEDVELTLTPGAELHSVKADRGQLEQVLMNLVVNARDAMPQGGKMQIATRNVEFDAEQAGALELVAGSYVELSVTDTGCGMDEATRARIFEPFFTTKGVGKGTGLGLSMVYGIARQSGGAIAVESALGEGSVFSLYLPKYEGAHTTETPPSSMSRRAGDGSETILVVDDEPALRAVIARVLAASGYDVRVATSPAEALALCQRDGAQIALVLTDVIMPGMNGRELVQRLAPLCPSAKIMFMSGYTDDLLEKHGVLGAGFLRKPFDWRTLALRVRAALDGTAPQLSTISFAPRE